MSHRRPHQWQFSRSRTALIDDADNLFALAKHYVSKASVYSPPHWFWMRAASSFDEAANHYREAGLGGMARILYGYAADCFDKQGMVEGASRCKALAESIPAYREEVNNE